MNSNVHIELTSLSSSTVTRFVVDSSVTIGMLCIKCKEADLLDSHDNGAIVLIGAGSRPRIFKLSEVDTRFMLTHEIQQLRCNHSNEPIRFQLVRLMSELWENPWKPQTSELSGPRNNLQESINTFSALNINVPKLIKFSQQYTQLRQLPWNTISVDIAENIARTCDYLDSSQAIMGRKKLQAFIKSWMTSCESARNLITWEPLRDDYASLNMLRLSRPGRHLANVMFTILSVERQRLASNCKLHVICNKAYVHMAIALNMVHPCYCFSNNVSNTMQALLWLAYEQKKYGFIISMIHHVANLQWDGMDDLMSLSTEQGEHTVS